MRIVRSSEHKPMPWKNGGGTTTEIAAHPPGAGMDDFLWRISMARVEKDGPFSVFDRVDRTLSILDGDGIRLAVDGATTDLTAASAPFAFPGDLPASATLIGGPVTDLNVMTRRGAATHRVWRLVWPVNVKSGSTSIVFCHQGTCTVSATADKAELQAGDAAIVENEALRVAPAAGGISYLIGIDAAS